MKNIDLNKKDGKYKTKKAKKGNNKKGDFLDFAQEKGIEFKIQYEDEKDQKKTFYQKDGYQKNFQGQGGKTYQKNYDDNYKKPYNSNYNNSTNYNQSGQDGAYPAKKNFGYQNNKKFGYQNFQNKSKNNKFDQANMMMYNQGMYNPMNKNIQNNLGGVPNQQGMNYGQQDFAFDPFFTPERTCEEILCYIFSVEFLNKELYLRKRISAEGLIDINHVMIFNK